MSISTEYGRYRDAITGIAKDHSLDGVDVQVLLALAEHGSLRSDSLEDVTYLNASQVRRATLHLRERDLITVEASDEKGGPPRRGVRLRATITDNGRFIANRVLGAVGPDLVALAA